jgi:hypothetical protein
MRASGYATAIVLLFFGATLSIKARDLSKYPCTVFNAEVCFRLPAGAELKYSMPSDFHLYEVTAGPASVATIYVGDGIDLPKVGGHVQVTRAADWEIRVVREGNAGLDVYISPSGKGGSVVHFSASTSPATLDSVRELASSLRPCRAIRTGGQRCPASKIWSSEILLALPRPTSPAS